MGHDRHVPEFARLPFGVSKPRLHGFRRLVPPLMLVLCSIASGCDSEAPAKIHVNLGARPEDQLSFVPKASLAEYTELPGEGAELRVILSSHPATCDAYVPLADDQILVAMTFSLPSGVKLQPGPYLWMGLSEHDLHPDASAPSTIAQAPANAARVPDAPSDDPQIARVLPFIRIGKRAAELPPGGHVELTEVRLDAQGTVRGLLKIEQAGSVGLPATSLLGSFAARWCRISMLGPNENH